jgi:hypothetical protein
MHTGQVAKLAYVDLKNFETRAAERERIFHKCLRESIHLKSAAPLAASALLRFMFVRIGRRYTEVYHEFGKFSPVDQTDSQMQHSRL